MFSAIGALESKLLINNPAASNTSVDLSEQQALVSLRSCLMLGVAQRLGCRDLGGAVVLRCLWEAATPGCPLQPAPASHPRLGLRLTPLPLTPPPRL